MEAVDEEVREAERAEHDRPRRQPTGQGGGNVGGRGPAA
jgi:hypothetical protein